MADAIGFATSAVGFDKGASDRSIEMSEQVLLLTISM